MRQSVRPQKQVQGLNHSQTNSNCQIDYDWNDGTQNQEKKFVVRGGGGVVACCVGGCVGGGVLIYAHR